MLTPEIKAYIIWSVSNYKQIGIQKNNGENEANLCGSSSDWFFRRVGSVAFNWAHCSWTLTPANSMRVFSTQPFNHKRNQPAQGIW